MKKMIRPLKICDRTMLFVYYSVLSDSNNWFSINKFGVFLKKYSGTATFGYLTDEPNETNVQLQGELFARRVAIAKLIDVIKDYGADGALEPIVTTRAVNAGKNTVEYHATATAKVVKIHSTNK